MTVESLGKEVEIRSGDDVFTGKLLSFQWDSLVYFVAYIDESKERDVEKKILWLYHKNRIGWLLGFIFIMSDVMVGMQPQNFYTCQVLYL